ncbi:MAG TPA: hypothetical protein VKY31_06995 [Terriglobia bacterium]|nr:hypothetical protein [Terriglobia bacterium]
MQAALLILALLQSTQAPALQAVRGDRFQVSVPQGWKVLTSDTSGDVVLDHSSGASLLIIRVQPPKSLQDYAQDQAERIMAPLGFAKLGEPKYSKEGKDEFVEYQIRGNRLSEHRRILYRALHRGTAYYCIVFEAPEDQYEALVTDAQNVAASVEALIQTPPARRVVRAKR